MRCKRARFRTLPYDICVTLAHRRGEVEGLFPPGIPVVGLSFIPAEETRALLAIIDPMARIGIVSIFPEFMALMKPGVLRFTPHVSDVEVRLITAPDLEEFLPQVDVAVYAERCGADLKDVAGGSAGDGVPLCAGSACNPRKPCFPVIERLRSAIATKEEKPS